MKTREQRAEIRKAIGRVGREELLQLLLEAWDQLDVADDAIGGDAIVEAMHGAEEV